MGTALRTVLPVRPAALADAVIDQEDTFAMSSPGDDRRTPARAAMTPLWVISLFLSLTEVMTGIAVLQAKGGVQVALTAFVIAFPCAVTAGFFAVLWKRPYVFYPPTEFGPGTDVTKYVEAMRRVQSDEGQIRTVIQESIRATMESPQLVERLSNGMPAHVSDIRRELNGLRKELANVAISKAESRFVTVDTSAITNDESPVVFPYESTESVSSFLDKVWFALLGQVPPHKYNDVWVLRDKASGRELRKMGSLWARSNGLTRDSRPLIDAGIVGGMRLEAILLKSSAD